MLSDFFFMYGKIFDLQPVKFEPCVNFNYANNCEPEAVQLLQIARVQIILGR